MPESQEVTPPVIDATKTLEPPTAQPAPKAAPPAAAEAKPGEAKQDNDPAWLPDRLKRQAEKAQSELLQQAGVESADQLKEKLAKLNELEMAQLSEAERVQKQIDELKPKAERASQLETLFSNMVSDQFSKLSEQQQTAIDAAANGNAEKRYELMQVLQAAAGQHVVTAPPASTVPSGNQPAPAPPPSPGQTQTLREQWQTLKTQNPAQAAVFYQVNRLAIEHGK